MLFNFFLIFFSLFFLIVLHELSHFLLAKIFGVKVEEFGIGYPPRLLGKKIGETIYSINLFPFGAFVKLFGEIEEKKEKGSFSSQPILKRSLIVLAGVFSFWIISFFIFSLLFSIGNPISISDKENEISSPVKVQIIQIAKNSPAELGGLKVGDTIKKMRLKDCSDKECEVIVDKIKTVQEFTFSHLGEKIILTLERANKNFEKEIIPRKFFPEGEGPMGVSLVRITFKKYSFTKAFFEGVKTTLNLTFEIFRGYFKLLSKFFTKEDLKVEIMGPIGIFDVLFQISQLGFRYFLNSLALISIYLAVFNLLPIPALDGGKILFLAIEALRGKPVSRKLEARITAFFFFLLIFLAILVTLKDITSLFF